MPLKYLLFTFANYTAMICHLLKAQDGTRSYCLILWSPPDDPGLCLLYRKSIQIPQRAGRISTKTVRFCKTLFNCLSRVNLYFQLWDGEIVGFGYLTRCPLLQFIELSY